MAVLLYTAIVWARQTRAAFVVRGILILGGIYIIARYLDLQMMAWVFQGFFAIFLIMIVVIFQEELRQFFERSPFGVCPKTSSASAPRLQISGSYLVGSGQGTRRRFDCDPATIRWSDTSRAGLPLEGKLSGALLKSIFRPHSPGHDGAVLVEQDCITRFAAHLPLSKNLTQLTNAGTRHSAALGLAESSDALCIVVSEERGTISVARDGQTSRGRESAAARRRDR